jgi:hypothetical protein
VAFRGAIKLSIMFRTMISCTNAIVPFNHINYKVLCLIQLSAIDKNAWCHWDYSRQFDIVKIIARHRHRRIMLNAITDAWKYKNFSWCWHRYHVLDISTLEINFRFLQIRVLLYYSLFNSAYFSAASKDNLHI